MSINRKTYSPEFKSKVALAAIREEGTLCELSSQFGVNANMIAKWKKQAIISLSDIFSGRKENAQVSNDAQIKELHAKIGELTIENDFLQVSSSRLALIGRRKW